MFLHRDVREIYLKDSRVDSLRQNEDFGWEKHLANGGAGIVRREVPGGNVEGLLWFIVPGPGDLRTRLLVLPGEFDGPLGRRDGNRALMFI
jgi:hypothetical protein